MKVMARVIPRGGHAGTEGHSGQARGRRTLNPLKNRLVSKTQEVTSVGEDVARKGPVSTVGGNASCCGHCGEQGRFLQN